MTTVANIKWYINGEERGVYEPAPELMTYQEIVAAATSEGYPWTNLISDLNEYPADYYSMLNDWWNLEIEYFPWQWIASNEPYIKSILYDDTINEDIYYIIYYNTWSNATYTWKKVYIANK